MLLVLFNYMTNHIIIFCDKKIKDMSILDILQYKPNIGKIFTKHEESCYKLSKIIDSGGTMKMNFIDFSEEKNDVYIDIIRHLTFNLKKVKEMKYLQHGEYYIYDRKLKKIQD